LASAEGTPQTEGTSVIAGHFGFAAGVKSRERAVPLWALMLATQWLDVVFIPLLLLGVEGLEPIPGTSEGYGQVIIHADYTHSLAGALLLAFLFGAVAAPFWGRRIGVVLGAVVFSHWVLDLIVHRGDMPLLPGDAGHLPRLGFGLWREPAASAALELLLVVAGTYLYFRAARQVLAATSQSPQRANVVSALVLVSGLLVLGLNLLGL
jgi:membrane-bound metal-dependent hydrolase YbcI (DUF457 family)